MKFVGATCPDKLVLLYICKGISSLSLSPCIVFYTVVINKNTMSLLPENRFFDMGICLKVTLALCLAILLSKRKGSVHFE